MGQLLGFLPGREPHHLDGVGAIANPVQAILRKVFQLRIFRSRIQECLGG
jgi:hypothetical protein